MIKIKFLIFYIHFFLYVIQQLALPDSIVSIAKLCIALLYVVSLILYTSSLSRGFKNVELAFLGLLSILILFKFIFVFSLNIPLIYWVLLSIMVIKMDWTKQELLDLINQVSIVYFILVLLLNYTPLQFLSTYGERDLINRFFPSIGRFVGLEGSPAGPDLLYTLVFIFNLGSDWKKRFFKLPMILAIIVLLWTASLSNIVALILAMIAYLAYPFRVIYAFFLMICFAIAVYVANTNSSEVLLIMDQVTSYRTTIWVSICNSLLEENTYSQWLFGRDQLMEFVSVFGEGYDANPHNLSLFALQFLGIPTFIGLISLICYKIRIMELGQWYFLTIFLIAYGVTNPMPFTLRGNPIIMYIFILCFVMYNQNLAQAKNKASKMLK